jgi:hypothetical protein
MTEPRSHLRLSALTLSTLAWLGCGVTPIDDRATDDTDSQAIVNPVTRRDAAAAVIQAAAINATPPAVNAFQDVPTSDAQFGAIEAMWREGMTIGCSLVNGVRTYCPDTPVTRGEMAVFLERAFVVFGQGPAAFSDVSVFHPYYQYIQALADNGLAEPCPGQPGKYCPDDPVSQADLAAMLARFANAGWHRPAANPIVVTAATYGGNAGAPAGNAGGPLAMTCNGRTVCNYIISWQALGDPVPNVAKDYLAEWYCHPGGPLHHAWAPPEAGLGSIVHLVCQ